MATLFSTFNPLRIVSRDLHKFCKTTYPWMNKWKPYWVRPDPHPMLDKDITEEHKAFLEEQRLLEYRMDTPLNDELWPRQVWTPGKSQRCGLIGVKLGNLPVWTAKEEYSICTLIQVIDNHALRYIPPSEIHHYADSFKNRPYMPHPDWMPRWFTHRRFGLQIVGALSADPRNFTKEWCGLFEEAGVPPKRKITRFLVSPDCALKPGTPLTIHHFRLGDRVDITARTVNRGFQGGMERWLFEGGPAGHGSTKFHRKMGSAAGGGGPIVRAKRMHGVMGNRYRTIRSVQIVRINYRYNILFIRGTTPGPTHSYCYIHDPWLADDKLLLDANPPPMPTAYPEDLTDEELLELPEDVYHSSILSFDTPSIVYPEDKPEKGVKRR